MVVVVVLVVVVIGVVGFFDAAALQPRAKPCTHYSEQVPINTCHISFAQRKGCSMGVINSDHSGRFFGVTVTTSYPPHRFAP